GVCLTAVAKGRDASGQDWFCADASAETLAMTTIGHWREGELVNLERPLRVGDELGGHIVSGHVDGTAEILSVQPDGDSMRFQFRAPEHLAPFIAPKGSIALDGTSLTVNAVQGAVFGVNIIPHTQAVTTWGNRKAGQRVNLEVDTLARYVARLNEGGALKR
ncbi:MAG TPA: riboflavin synthase, partial [Alphaproteobacteria bacterium]|nr:riboflavin synthase [Alphaproteobacteria bacterium]